MLFFCQQREAFMFLLFLATFHLLFPSSIGDAETLTFRPIKLNCSSDSFTKDDTVETSLEALFSSLRSKALCSNSGEEVFVRSPNTISGSFLCQSDLPREGCQTCIHIAATSLLRSCSSSRRGAIWINYCQLRYSVSRLIGAADAKGFNLASLYEEINSMKPIEEVSKPMKAIHLRRLMDASPPTAAGDGGYFLT